jgi:two-component system phosphate regulon response regulator PhoB
VVEDEDALATLLQYNLDKEGYSVVVAMDGEEALMQADEAAPDLVLLDWMLPKVSGVEVCRRLRGGPRPATLPIIMLTARGEEGDRIRGLDTGADDYVVKPFSMVELTARVRAVLRRIRPGLADDRSATATSSSTASPTASNARATTSTWARPSSSCSTT